MRITFTKKESFDLLKAWLAISLAFGILSRTYFLEFGILNSFLLSFGISLLTAGLGFLIHELAHKVIAIKHYCSAEFKANNTMLVLAIIMSFAGFIFAAPGAVMIKGGVNKKQNGEIAYAGPFSNLVLGLMFLPGIFFAKGILQFFFFQGLFINSWLALFNMIPLEPFDGFKILRWNKTIYVITATILLFLVINLLYNPFGL